MRQASLPAALRDRLQCAYRERIADLCIEVSDALPEGCAALAGPDRLRVHPAAWHPGTAWWTRLMAHEVAHVVQARRAIAAGAPRRPGILVEAAVEAAADIAAAHALAGLPTPPALLQARSVGLRPTILAETSGGDGFANVVVAAINALTHAGAVKLGAAVTKYGTPYKQIVPDVAAPSPHPHARSWLLISRMMANAHECKIKASPGTDYGTAYDVVNTGAPVPPTMVVDPITMPKAIKSSGARAKITWPPVPIATFNLDTTIAVGRQQASGAVPAFIILAHELSHADRIMRGTSLMPKVGSTNGEPASAQLGGGYNVPSFAVDFEHVEMVGWTATSGTTPYVCKDPDVVTENEVRREHGVAARTRY